MSALQKLREVCEAATPGPWVHWPGNSVYASRFPAPDDEADTDTIDEWFEQARSLSYGDIDKPNAEFIATFDPQLVSRLLDVAEAVDNTDCLNDCGNGPDRRTCESPLCRAIAALEAVVG